jgi:hypothetical protein
VDGDWEIGQSAGLLPAFDFKQIFLGEAAFREKMKELGVVLHTLAAPRECFFLNFRTFVF